MSGQKANSGTVQIAHGIGAEIEYNSSGGGAADWIMLLPAGKALATVDSRGPWLVDDADKLAVLSMQGVERLPIDENHSTDLAAPTGAPSPARGWIVEMQSRPEGIFGRVEWSQTGAALLAERAYRFLSPVLAVDKGKRVLRILRASLTNSPNVRGMEALNQVENDQMDLLAKLREALGLPADADEAAVIAKIKALNSGAQTAANAMLAPIAAAAGLKGDADAATVLNAVTTLAASAKSVPGAGAIKELQDELAEVAKQLNAVTVERSTDRATAFVDAAIKAGRVGVKPLRDHYIKRHLADPVGVETEINSFLILGASGALETPPPVSKDGKIELNADQKKAADVLGVSHDAYAKTLAAEAAGT